MSANAADEQRNKRRRIAFFINSLRLDMNRWRLDKNRSWLNTDSLRTSTKHLRRTAQPTAGTAFLKCKNTYSLAHKENYPDFFGEILWDDGKHNKPPSNPRLFLSPKAPRKRSNPTARSVCVLQHGKFHAIPPCIIKRRRTFPPENTFAAQWRTFFAFPVFSLTLQGCRRRDAAGTDDETGYAIPYII